MQKMEIDYSGIAQPSVDAREEWDPPVHKFFGKKLPNGKTEKEPIYSFVPYPSMMYAVRDGKIVARVVNSDQEKDALGADWSDTPAKFGYIGAPSFDQVLAMRAESAKPAEAEESVIGEAPRRGRPPKAA